MEEYEKRSPEGKSINQKNLGKYLLVKDVTCGMPYHIA